MNVRCPSCETVYRVDPAKVPDEGVRASCATCGSVFPVTHQREERSSAETQQPIIEQQPEPVEAVDTPVPDIAPPSEAPAPAFELASADDSSDETAAAPVSLADTPSAPQAPETILDFDPLPIEVPEIDEPVVPQPATPLRQEPPAREHEPPAPEQQQPAATPVVEFPTKPKVSKPFLHPGAGPSAAPTPRAPSRPTAPVFRPTPGMPMQAPPVPETTQPVRPVAPQAPSEKPKASAPPAAPVSDKKPVNPFLSKDPSMKARRLARALVSDMIVYQPKKRQDALAAGNIKDAFDEEIKKSWEEYVQQVGEDLADSTDYFKEALNEILAGGRSIF
jgi:predicted Zn finger-like uncharacterized protein